jgi:hypothetical protein
MLPGVQSGETLKRRPDPTGGLMKAVMFYPGIPIVCVNCGFELRVVENNGQSLLIHDPVPIFSKPCPHQGKLFGRPTVELELVPVQSSLDSPMPSG